MDVEFGYKLVSILQRVTEIPIDLILFIIGTVDQTNISKQWNPLVKFFRTIARLKLFHFMDLVEILQILLPIASQ